ncbi:hypothetical protein FBEOM_8953 [Fusarium beomiforme]|uniref:Mitochondrial division protein 1 n=1 Tax=Fusarium beomiforme TaxID=44412 RepID=A0A9P5DTT2_9HYPO|nr:hypothetical protein FBEOM_8953 [Fusarium beomiforme]
MSQGVKAVQTLKGIITNTEVPGLYSLVEDARRYVLSHRGVIEIALLQAYVSALVFSPKYSRIRELFKQEEPDWIISKPKVEANWYACLKTLEGHDDGVSSVVFSADGQRLTSSSYDKTIKIWDAHSGECLKILKVNRVLTDLIFDLTTNHCLYTEMGPLKLDLPLLPLATDGQTMPVSRGTIRSGYGIGTDGIWIVKDRKRMLWLPPEYRSPVSAVVKSAVAIGCRSGRVLVMKFS